MPVRPSELSARFSPNVLSRQFLLCRSASLIPEGWHREGIADWILGFHPTLTISRFGSETGGLYGWLIGYAVHSVERRFVFGPGVVPTVPPLSGFDDLERWTEDLTGEYVIIAFSASRGRLYLDAAGARSVVWCAHQGICASSPALVPYDGSTPDDDDLIRALGIPESKRYFPFGATPRYNIHRLLPNHYLDLDEWTAVRHWPVAPFENVSPPDAVDELVARLSGVMQAVCAREEPLLPLTAGRDSRMLLACAKALSPQIQFFTWELPDGNARADVQVARKLTSALGLRHTVYPFRGATSEDTAEWLYRTGCAVGEPRGMSLATTVKQMPPRFYLPGIGAEVGRAVYWRESNLADIRLSAEELLVRLKHPAMPRLVEHAASWLDAVPVEKTSDVLDLMFLEQRVGCWAGVWDLGFADGPLRLAPFCNRRIFTILLGLPNEYRIERQWITDIINREWPELFDIVPSFPGPRKSLIDLLRPFVRKVPGAQWAKRLLR